MSRIVQLFCAAGFYLWGTMLARIPIGENQFYVGTKLEDYVNGGFAVEGEVEFFEDLAVRAYLSVLNNFPDAVTYDATGTVPTPLATWTCEKLIGLGEPLPAGWLMTTDEDDNALCVHLDLEIE